MATADLAGVGEVPTAGGAGGLGGPQGGRGGTVGPAPGDVAVEQLAFEFMLNALRLDDGVPIATFEQRTGLSRNDIAAPLAEAREHGWLEADPSALRPTESGRRFLNDLIALFLPD